MQKIRSPCMLAMTKLDPAISTIKPAEDIMRAFSMFVLLLVLHLLAASPPKTAYSSMKMFSACTSTVFPPIFAFHIGSSYISKSGSPSSTRSMISKGLPL